jgi:hypothetical protein
VSLDRRDEGGQEGHEPASADEVGGSPGRFERFGNGAAIDRQTRSADLGWCREWRPRQQLDGVLSPCFS